MGCQDTPPARLPSAIGRHVALPLAVLALVALSGCARTAPWVTRRGERDDLDFRAAIGAGLAVAGTQDLKLKRHDAKGTLTDYLFSRDVDGRSAPVAVGTLGFWGRHGTWRHFGIQLAASYWKTRAEADAFINRNPQGKPAAEPPFRQYRQRRLAFFLSALGRFAVPGQGPFDPDGTYLYAGVGGGPVRTSVEHGHTGWKIGFQALLGLSQPLSDRVRLRVEARYTAAPDADSAVRSYWQADTSGVRAWPGFAHMDTRFFEGVLMLEVDL